MNKDEFVEEIKKLNINVTDKMLEQLEIYKEFLQEYNKHTNLTTIIKDEDIYLKHFYDSLTIVKAIDLNSINNLLDIGTGAGFPGMIIKIFYPKIKVTLLDSNNKKIAFLQELAQKLNISVELIHSRIEEYSKSNLNKFDLVTARAVANLRVLVELSLPLVNLDGLFVAFKGTVSPELAETKETIELLHGKILKIEKFPLYKGENERNIVIIRKYVKTKQSELRTYNKIIKKPLQKTNK